MLYELNYNAQSNIQWTTLNLCKALDYNTHLFHIVRFSFKKLFDTKGCQDIFKIQCNQKNQPTTKKRFKYSQGTVVCVLRYSIAVKTKSVD